VGVVDGVHVAFIPGACPPSAKAAEEVALAGDYQSTSRMVRVIDDDPANGHMSFPANRNFMSFPFTYAPTAPIPPYINASRDLLIDLAARESPSRRGDILLPLLLFRAL
jgi:hypothetical protein